MKASGFGGINAHAVLEEHRSSGETFSCAHQWETELIVLSASSRSALADVVGRLWTFLDANRDVALRDVAFAQCSRRPSLIATGPSSPPHHSDETSGEGARKRRQHTVVVDDHRGQSRSPVGRLDTDT